MPSIAVIGNMGQGKTLTMSALATYLAEKNGLKLYANYNLKGAERITTFSALLAAKNGVVAIDEAGVVIDSRCFKDNVKLTQWLVQTRHVGLIVMMTAQAFHQLDKRARDTCDFIFNCERNALGINVSVIDWTTRKLTRKYTILAENIPKFGSLYDTHDDPVSVIRYDGEKKEYSRNKWH